MSSFLPDAYSDTLTPPWMALESAAVRILHTHGFNKRLPPETRKALRFQDPDARKATMLAVAAGCLVTACDASEKGFQWGLEAVNPLKHGIPLCEYWVSARKGACEPQMRYDLRNKCGLTLPSKLWVNAMFAKIGL